MLNRKNHKPTEIKGAKSSSKSPRPIPPLPQNPFAFAIYFIKSFKWPLLAMVFLEAGQATSQILLPNAIKDIIDTITKFQDQLASLSQEEILSNLSGPLWTFFGLSVGVLIFSRSSGAILIYVGPALRRLSRYNLYHYLQHHSHHFFTSNFSGALSNRINEVSVGINHSLWTIVFDFWPVFISFSVSIFLLSQAHLQLALYLGGWIFLYVLISFFLARKAKRYSQKFAAARSKVSGKVVDAVTNIFNTQMFSNMRHERKHLKNHLDFEVSTARTSIWFMEKMRWFQFIAALILQLGILYLSITKWTQGFITIGEFVMVTSLSLLIINDARGLSRRFLEFFEYMGNISDGVNMMVQKHELVDTKEAPPLHIIGTGGAIEYKGVHFQYQNTKPLFTDFNVQISKGEKVGLVGFSGSGKSTFINLIIRLYDIQKGQILVDGQDISKVTMSSLRESVAIIPQSPILFHRSLMENIRYGKLSATDEEVIRAAKMAAAHEFIQDLPESYDSLVGERGVKLSGGQRQRIAIAMAILKNSPILILDEATSSLDSKTERLIQVGIKQLMANKTVVAAAHRLSTITAMDRILVFHHGKVIESGSHEELLAKDGHYAMLWELQSGGFLPHKPLAPDSQLLEEKHNPLKSSSLGLFNIKG